MHPSHEEHLLRARKGIQLNRDMIARAGTIRPQALVSTRPNTARRYAQSIGGGIAFRRLAKAMEKMAP